MSDTGSPYHFTPTHSRDSSGASSASASSPVTPTFSNRSHSRWPSSTSSLATTPDSPVNVTKSPLHDLVEDPAEREDAFFDGSGESDEPLCICDTPFCEHRRTVSQSAVLPRAAAEWAPDDSLTDVDLSTQGSVKRRKSGELAHDRSFARLSRHLPSLSRRWRDHQPTTSLSSPSVRSAPPSRSSSVRISSLQQSLAGQLEPRGAVTSPGTPVESQARDSVLTTRAQALYTPVDIKMPTVEDPIDREQLASTPLLPPMFTEHKHESRESIQSPLQSPTVAEASGTFSYANTPVGTPVLPGMPTPPLSSKPSVTSFHMPRSGHVVPAAEIPSMTIAEEDDSWAAQLGHANFHITPEPWMPAICDSRSCKHLLEDW